MPLFDAFVNVLAPAPMFFIFLGVLLRIMASFVGGLISWVFLALLSPPLANFALKFGPYELFTLVLMALVLIATIAEGTLVKGLLIALFGIAVAMVGPDSSSGVLRLNFGFDAISGGFSLLPVLLGVFVISQIIEDVLKKEVQIKQQGGRLTEFMPSASDVKKTRGQRGAFLAYRHVDRCAAGCWQCHRCHCRVYHGQELFKTSRDLWHRRRSWDRGSGIGQQRLGQWRADTADHTGDSRQRC